MKKVKLDAWERGFRKIEREHFNTTKHELYHKKYKGMVVPLWLWARCFAELDNLAKEEFDEAKRLARDGFPKQAILHRMAGGRKYKTLARELEVLKLGTWVQAY